jgi:hypothetical protein
LARVEIDDEIFAGILGALGGLALILLLVMTGQVDAGNVMHWVILIISAPIGIATSMSVYNWIIEERDSKLLKLMGGLGGMGSAVAVVSIAAMLLTPALTSAAGLPSPLAEDEPVPEAPDAESVARGTVWNAYSDPLTGISGADIAFYAEGEEPMAGEANPSSIYTDNTDSSGSFKTDLSEYPQTNLWVTAYDDNNYYSEKDKVQTAKTATGVDEATFDMMGEPGLARVGTLGVRITNIQNGAGNAENVALSTNTITLDNGEGPFTFDLVIEEDAGSEYALLNLAIDAEEGGSFSSVDPTIEHEITTEEGVDASWVDGSYETWSDDQTEGEIIADGFLEHNNDLVIRITVEDLSGSTGDIATYEINDLLDSTGVEGESGIPQETITLTVS